MSETQYCVLCYESYLNSGSKKFNYFSQHHSQLVSCCAKYISVDIVNIIKSINWQQQPNGEVPYVCEECNVNAETLNLLNIQLDELTTKITTLAHCISFKIRNARGGVQQQNWGTHVLTVVDDRTNIGTNAASFEPEATVTKYTTTVVNYIDKDSFNYDQINDNESTLSDSRDEFFETNGNSFQSEAFGGIHSLKEGQSIKKKKRSQNLQRDFQENPDSIALKSSDIIPHLDNDQGFTCQSCGKTFSRISILKRHHCDKKTHECSTCGKSFSTAFVLKLHSRCHTGEQPYKCETCGKCFSIKYNLVRHIRTHTGEKPFICKICEKAFADETGFVRHQNTHKGQNDPSKKIYKCEICSKVLSDYGNLKDHVLIHTKYLRCDICGKSFRTEPKLTKHKSTHDDKSVECEECGKRLSTKQAYNNHILMHKGVKPYHCEECGKSFRGQVHFKHHLAQHLSAKGNGETFICEVCGKIYIGYLLLKRHRRTAHKEYSRTCETCDKRFRTNQQLTKHMNTRHSTARPFVCEKCGKTFKTKNDVSRHDKNVHSGPEKQPLVCTICEKTFKQKANLAVHMRRCTKVQNTSVRSAGHLSQGKVSAKKPQRRKGRRIEVISESEEESVASVESEPAHDASEVFSGDTDSDDGVDGDEDEFVKDKIKEEFSDSEKTDEEIPVKTEIDDFVASIKTENE